MWPWRRGGRTEPASAGGAPAAAPEPVFRSAGPPAWTSLPAMPAVVGAHPLVNPPERMPEVLTSWHSPAFLASLGHVVSAAEPSGLIDHAPSSVQRSQSS